MKIVEFSMQIKIKINNVISILMIKVKTYRALRLTQIPLRITLLLVYLVARFT